MKQNTSTRIRTVISILLIIGLMAAGFGALRFFKSFAREAEQSESKVAPTSVNVLTLKPHDFQETFNGYGRARPLLQTTVSSEVQGVVTRVAPELEAGAAVVAGRVLIEIDDRDYREALGRHQAALEQNAADEKRQLAEVNNLERQLDVARKEFELSRSELRRRIEMKKTGVAADDEVDRQRRATKAVELSLLRIENNLSLGRNNAARIAAVIKATKLDIQRAERDIARCRLPAPFAGSIVNRHVQLGTRVAPGTELFQVVDTGRIEVPISLPASYYGDVKVGASVELHRTNNKSQRWTAAVARIAPNVSPEDRTFLVYIELEGAPGTDVPEPGAFLEATIRGPMREDVYVIPRTAFLEDAVFVTEEIAEEGVSRVSGLVLKIDRLLPDVALSRDPAAEGRLVVLDNLEQIASGSLVRVMEIRSHKGAVSK